MKSKIIIGLLVIVLIGGGATFIITKTNNKESNVTQVQNENNITQIQNKKDELSVEYTGELVQGVEYVDGPYTYRYKQKSNSYSGKLQWTDIEQDGWGVAVTDANSTSLISGKLLKSIGGKPIVSTERTFMDCKAESIDLTVDLHFI